MSLTVRSVSPPDILTSVNTAFKIDTTNVISVYKESNNG